MLLKETYSFSPSKHALTINSEPFVLAIHPSSDYLAFATRNRQLVLFNRKTGRSTVIYRSKFEISSAMFTQQYLVCVDKEYPEILVFSLKTQKLKKKVTGHRSQVVTLAFCPQRSLFCTASQDLCIIWDQATLNSLKKLKCSTSEYFSCTFSLNGQYLFTSFSDGNVFQWNLDSYSFKQAALSIEAHSLSCNYGSYLVAYSRNSVMLSNFTFNNFIFEAVEPFWQGEVIKVQFVNHLLFVFTTSAFYVTDLTYEHKFVVRNVKQLIDPIYGFISGGYGTEVVVVNKQLNKIRVMNVFNERISAVSPLTNPLINPGNHCPGGFGNQDGCIMGSDAPVAIGDYADQEHQIECLNQGTYECNQTLPDEKLRKFIHKNYYFPQKYRPIAYKSLLNLPINKNEFRRLEKLGRHDCTRMLETKYPLNNRNLAEAMKDILSLLAHYSPIFAESDDVPSIIFPFVCLFGNDRFLCFEIVYRLFNNWLSFLFVDFPVANSDFLQNILQILEVENKTILAHLKATRLSFTKLTWFFISTLFTVNVKQEVFLSIVDTLFANKHQPQFIIFILLSYICLNESRILSLRSEHDLNTFLSSEHTINISNLMRNAYYLSSKYQSRVRYRIATQNMADREYCKFEYFPYHAIKMHEGKRKLEQEEYDKAMGECKYSEELRQEMQKMITKVKRSADKAMIEGESVALQAENQSKAMLHLPKPNSRQRTLRLEQLMEQLETMFQQSEGMKQQVKKYAPLLSQIRQEANEEQLDIMEDKLMKLMTKFEPQPFHQPLHSQPLALTKNKAQDFKNLKAAKNAQITRMLWENDTIQHKIQEDKWNDKFMNSVV